MKNTVNNLDARYTNTQSKLDSLLNEDLINIQQSNEMFVK